MNGVTQSPRYVVEPASWDVSKKQYRVLEYGQTVAVCSSRKAAARCVAVARRESTPAIFRRLRRNQN